MNGYTDRAGNEVYELKDGSTLRTYYFDSEHLKVQIFWIREINDHGTWSSQMAHTIINGVLYGGTGLDCTESVEDTVKVS